jgi:hypothetical protein
MCHLHILPVLGDKMKTDLTTFDLEEYIPEWIKEDITTIIRHGSIRVTELKVLKDWMPVGDESMECKVWTVTIEETMETCNHVHSKKVIALKEGDTLFSLDLD